MSKQSTGCCRSGAAHEAICWPARVLRGHLAASKPVNHSALWQYTGARSDKSVYGVAFEFVKEVWHMRVLGFASKGNLYFDKGCVSSVR